jgi:hypothetical protein
MLIKDLIVLGRACPEPLKDGRVTVCLAGWSADYGFIRLYPTRFDTPCKRWDVIEVDVELNEQDTRKESRKIVGSKREWETLATKIKVVNRINNADERRHFLANLRDPSVDYVNQELRSLGIIKPNILRTHFQKNRKYGELYQSALPGFTEHDQIMVKRDFEHEPHVTFTCPEGENPDKRHDPQILDWGFYEWFRKNPENIEQIWENAGFSRDTSDLYFLIGNQAAYRNSFMVISVLSVPKGDADPVLFPYRRLADD